MAKIKLGARPKHFPAKITVALPEGGEGTIELQFVYRTRVEFGQFVDDLLQAAKVPAPAPAAGEAGDQALAFSVREAIERTRDTNADYIMQIVAGWNLDEEFSRAAVVQLCNELPGAALAIIERYRAAITEGRLGN